MKGGLVAAVWAIRAIVQSEVNLGGDLLLASVMGEEDGGFGSYALLRRGWRADACVIPEPTGLDIVPANAGALTFRLRVHGKATHASRRTEGVSALERFWPIWQALHELERERNAQVDPLMRRWPVPYALSIGTVRCGDWASSVPDLLVAEGRLGVALDESPAAARAAFEAAVQRASAPDARVDVEWWGGQFASGRLPAGSDLVERMQAAHRSATGRQAAVWGAPYGSDLRLLTGLGSIPTIHYGPGDAGLAHGPDESVPVDEVTTAARALALLALDLAG
jgi:acetylornithine deacetylase